MSIYGSYSKEKLRNTPTRLDGRRQAGRSVMSISEQNAERSELPLWEGGRPATADRLATMVGWALAGRSSEQGRQALEAVVIGRGAAGHG